MQDSQEANNNDQA